ncbi:thiamine biosynthesis lipoprotein [Austwickia chelonae]|uniref:FAD:protein FMN transferase n=1 Tax=Austwickia chelonae NBRC 105200 TaxID=1184607 RepID=K6W905_9MICO|nr:FAD:protein FMN transferase [Austwickia chelonae]GAB78312.1 ApbE family protein [Austwickia chelonae NBRC 105200]SEW01037.1 thiamine biosynthesis lipoprotein [Austwickia chelonae]
MSRGPADLPDPPPACPPPPYVAAYVRRLMGMPVSIHLRGPDPRSPRAVEAVGKAYDELARAEEIFSRWQPHSELSRLRRGELTLTACGPQMREVAALCAHYQQVTGGSFTAVLPDETTGEPSYDPTGLVKGWAVARAAGHLAAVGGHAYCLNAGGDLLVGGIDESPGGGRPWRLGIDDPDIPGRVAGVVELHAGALATSGCSARGAHLVDPATGRRERRRGSVSVIAPDIVEADAWATALFVGPAGLETSFLATPDRQVIRY